MTVTALFPANRRIRPIAGHIYILPVVREVPAPPADAATARAW
jgi:hypothetical protein